MFSTFPSVAKTQGSVDIHICSPNKMGPGVLVQRLKAHFLLFTEYRRWIVLAESSATDSVYSNFLKVNLGHLIIMKFLPNETICVLFNSIYPIYALCLYSLRPVAENFTSH